MHALLILTVLCVYVNTHDEGSGVAGIHGNGYFVIRLSLCLEELNGDHRLLFCIANAATDNIVYDYSAQLFATCSCCDLAIRKLIGAVVQPQRFRDAYSQTHPLCGKPNGV